MDHGQGLEAACVLCCGGMLCRYQYLELHNIIRSIQVVFASLRLRKPGCGSRTSTTIFSFALKGFRISDRQLHIDFADSSVGKDGVQEVSKDGGLLENWCGSARMHRTDVHSLSHKFRASLRPDVDRPFQ